MKSLVRNLTLVTCAATLAAAPAVFAGEGKFKKLDSDGDGRVSRSEHAVGSNLMFTQADTNGDGVLSASEMSVKHDSKADSTAQGTSSTRGNSQGDVARAADKIEKIDQNGDGKVTASEHEAMTHKKFAKLDADGDGFLSESELEAGHKQWK